MLGTDFGGYEWGWMVDGGNRKNLTPGEAAKPNDIIGVWGKVYRVSKRESYVETFLEEFQAGSPESSSWRVRPLLNLLDLNRQQCIKAAYPENYSTSSEVYPISQQAKEVDNRRTLQRWKCTVCGHTFYTDLPDKPTLMQRWQRLKSLEFFKLSCEVCNKRTCRKDGKVKKEVVS